MVTIFNFCGCCQSNRTKLEEETDDDVSVGSGLGSGFPRPHVIAIAENPQHRALVQKKRLLWNKIHILLRALTGFRAKSAPVAQRRRQRRASSIAEVLRDDTIRLGRSGRERVRQYFANNFGSGRSLDHPHPHTDVIKIPLSHKIRREVHLMRWRLRALRPSNQVI